MAAPDGQVSNSFLGSWRYSIDVTPSDSATYVGATRAIMVTVSGNVQVRFAGDQEVRVIPMVASQPLPLAVDRIYSTNTTANGIKAFW